ncbi:hypothetical protein PENTCL1PPCAC_24124 [Pristionchus entomophagus]|uniref:Uncharacterized protein n=1 Tax=Pristionchus entomophagus TaxID=358040 RepID=A0AAV5U709_9BILA|nr:hypothetical protein PENTCL1PPCAC_24124 [Pristionchus entomophagus]
MQLKYRNPSQGTRSLDQVTELFAAIGKAQPQMVDNSRNLTLLHFSRAFGVVMEEAIMRIDEKKKKRSNDESGNDNHITGSSNDNSSCSCEPKDDLLVSAAGAGAAPTGANGRPTAPVAIVAPVANSKKLKDSLLLPVAGTRASVPSPSPSVYGRPPSLVLSTGEPPKDSWQLPVAGSTGAYGRPPPSMFDGPTKAIDGIDK